MIINIKFGSATVQVEGDVYIDSDSMDIVITDPCVDVDHDITTSDLEEIGRLLHENLTDDEISDRTGINASYIDEIRRCTKPEYSELKLVSYGWPEMAVIEAVRKMGNK